jgi:Telomere-binding protein beta subunit (TEBP beta)
MRVYVHEIIPHIWLSDGYHFIEGHFTKDAINDFRKNYNIKFSNLREKILIVTKWRLVMKYEDSRQSYTSYQNLSVHLVVENFRPLMYEKVAPRQVH